MVDLSQRLASFAGLPLVVLGDMVADEYIHGTTSRISREAPVLIVAQDQQEIRPGGAANVVANLCALGGLPRPVGLLGRDSLGEGLRSKLEACGADCSGLVVDDERFTTAKTRILAGGANTVRQQMLRIDRLNREPVRDKIVQGLVQGLEQALRGASALVVSDYGEGVVGGQVLQSVLDQVALDKTPVFVDSRYGVAGYTGADTLTPNEPELEAASGMTIRTKDDLERAGRWLVEKSRCRQALVKRGRNGMALFSSSKGVEYIPAYGSDEVADVTGAGDTVLAAYSLARAAGCLPPEAMVLANMAGGIKITKSGTAVVSAAELRQALTDAGAGGG